MRNHVFTWKCEGHNLVLQNNISCPECVRIAREKLHAKGIAHRPKYLIAQELQFAKDKQAALEAPNPPPPEPSKYTFNTPTAQMGLPPGEHPLTGLVLALFQLMDTHKHSELDQLRMDYEYEITRRQQRNASALVKRMAKEVIRDAIQVFLVEHPQPVPCFDDVMRETAERRLTLLFQQGQRVTLTANWLHTPRRILTENEEHIAEQIYLFATTSSQACYHQQKTIELVLNTMTNPTLEKVASNYIPLVERAVIEFRRYEHAHVLRDYGSVVRTVLSERFAEAYLSGHRRD